MNDSPSTPTPESPGSSSTVPAVATFVPEAYVIDNAGWGNTVYTPVRIVRKGKATVTVASEKGYETTFNLIKGYGKEPRLPTGNEKLRQRGAEYHAKYLSFNLAETEAEKARVETQVILTKRSRELVSEIDRIIGRYRSGYGTDAESVGRMEGALAVLVGASVTTPKIPETKIPEISS